MQWQPNCRTVQNSLEMALEPLFGAKVRIVPSSRTDAGVHASGQVAHFDAPVLRPPASVIRAGNVGLPNDVRIVSAHVADEKFHARFSAKWRSYTYRISPVPIAIGRQYAWQLLSPIDREVLFSQAQFVHGTHVFSAFAHESQTEKHDYQCSVFQSRWYEEAGYLVYRIDASRFVHGMVRLLVGTMVDIASGRGNLLNFPQILASKDNRTAGTKAPACGLTLTTVGYKEWPEA